MTLVCHHVVTSRMSPSMGWANNDSYAHEHTSYLLACHPSVSSWLLVVVSLASYVLG